MSRPNSMEINGVQNNKRNSLKELKKSSSQDIQKLAQKAADEAKKTAEEIEVPLAEEEIVSDTKAASPVIEEKVEEVHVAVPEVEENKKETVEEEVKTTADDPVESEQTQPGTEEKNQDDAQVTDQRDSGGSAVTATASTNGVTTPNGHGAMATNAVMAASPQAKAPKFEIIAVRERHGMFRKAVPVMPVSVAVIFCLLNVITPGIGTLCAGFTVLCGCPTEHDNRPKALFYNIIAAILQLVTAPIVIGWVWSIMWGVTFVNVSVTKGVDEAIVTAHV